MLTKDLKNKIESCFEKKVVHEINYNDLDYIVNAYYNIKDYEVVAFEEWGNYQSHDYNIIKQPLSDHQQKIIETFKIGKKRHYIIDTILTDLCNNDVIPEGNILIDVFW